MKVGIPKEVKDHEYRVGLTPDAVKIFIQSSLVVFLDNYAGLQFVFTF